MSTYIFVYHIENAFKPEHIVEDLHNELANLEYGDVADGDYQVWEYPSGKIFQITSDREVDDDNFYSTPYTSKGTIWEPQLTEIFTDQAKVHEAYRKLSQSSR